MSIKPLPPPTLPLPNPYEWMTVGAAAQFMKVDRRTVERLIARKVLTGHRPYQADGERPLQLLWRDEVLTVHASRQRLAAGAAG